MSLVELHRWEAKGEGAQQARRGGGGERDSYGSKKRSVCVCVRVAAALVFSNLNIFSELYL